MTHTSLAAVLGFLTLVNIGVVAFAARTMIRHLEDIVRRVVSVEAQQARLIERASVPMARL